MGIFSLTTREIMLLALTMLSFIDPPHIKKQPNGSALSCEPQRLRGSIEAPSFDARRRHWPIRARCGSAAAAPC
jgi:hypothetical protein